MILLALDTTDDRPIYAQISDQIKAAVASGVLRPGELAPSVRELSKQLVINPNTVARAYRELQAEGLLASVRGTGLEVTAAAPAHCRADRREAARARLRSAIEEARRCGLEFAEIEAVLHAGRARENGNAN